MNKQMLLDALKKDIEEGKLQMCRMSPLEFRRDAINYHVVKDEIEYIESLISMIEGGTYDV